MARKAFYSFHYEPDNWRASQVRQIGAIEGNQPAPGNTWENVKSSNETTIKRWIDAQMAGRSVVVVLVGSETAGRKWINYEITKGWEDGRGVLGIHIHNLTDRLGRQSRKGSNPFSGFNIGGVSLASIVNCHEPRGSTSKGVYSQIQLNIADWVETAISIRGQYGE